MRLIVSRNRAGSGGDHPKPRALALLLVERILGGPSEAVSRRGLTEIEREVAAEGLTELLNQYAQGWSRLEEFSPKVQEISCDVLSEKLLVGVDYSLVTEFSVKLAGVESKLFIHLLLPECNPLIPLWHYAEESFVPAAKAIPVRLER